MLILCRAAFVQAMSCAMLLCSCEMLDNDRPMDRVPEQIRGSRIISCPFSRSTTQLASCLSLWEH